MRCLTFILLMISALAFAQSAPVEEPDSSEQVPVADEACIPDSETSQAPGDESGPSEDGGTDASAQDTEACEEQPETPATPVEPVTESGPQDIVEDNFYDEESAGQEFEPEEEISEDYPVPLPADI